MEDRHARVLETLARAVAADDRLRALELQCSVARGVGDELSDLDLGLWASDDDWNSAVAETRRILNNEIGDVVDAFEREDERGMYFFVHYDDAPQVDLLVQRASRARGQIDTAVVLVDKDGLLAQPWKPQSKSATHADLGEWSFMGWLALWNLAKYLTRGSLWEAHAQLELARTHALRLHAAREEVPYPAFGLTALLDADRPTLPRNLDETVATLDARELRRAALALAGILEDVAERRPLAAVVRQRLEDA